MQSTCSEWEPYKSCGRSRCWNGVQQGKISTSLPRPFTMHRITVVFPLLASLWLGVHASPTPRAASISWSPCGNGNNITSSLLCGTLEVPRDYTKPNSNETITLYLANLPATKQPNKGSIFLNTGGPGLPQRNDLLGIGGKGFQLFVHT